MSRAELATVVGIVATAVTFVHVVPQIVRLMRTGRVEGVSAAWASVAVTLNFGWMAYVIAEEFWITIPSILVAIVSFGSALYLMHRNGADVRPGVLMSVAVAVASVGIQMAAGWTVLATVLALSNGLYLGPSVLTVWRSHAPTGVSPLTWALAVLEGLLWGSYGALAASGPITVFGATEAGLSALVLLRLWVARDRIRAALGHAA